MARQEKITKEILLKNGINFIKEYGINNLNARDLSKYINCSTQPIFRNFINMDDYKKELKVELRNNYTNFINRIIDKNDYLFTISYAYALYAKEEPNLFYALFITDMAGSRTMEEVINTNRNKDTITQMQEKYDISKKEAESLYLDTRFYTHGIATQLYCKSIILTEKEIKILIKRTIEKLLK